jgi:chromosome partition protein MukE
LRDSSFHNLEEVLEDQIFPEVDLALRRGHHIDRDEPDRYAFLSDSQSILEFFYRRYGCELVHTNDGFFYLLPLTDEMGRRHLTAGEMLVGQTLALLYLDLATVQAGGLVQQETVVSRLSGLIGQRELIQALNPRRRKYDERVAQETVRGEIAKAIRSLSYMGFIDLIDEARIRLRVSLLRFAESVRGMTDPQEALSKLVAEGKAVVLSNDKNSNDDEQESAEL